MNDLKLSFVVIVLSKSNSAKFEIFSSPSVVISWDDIGFSSRVMSSGAPSIKSEFFFVWAMNLGGDPMHTLRSVHGDNKAIRYRQRILS